MTNTQPDQLDQLDVSDLVRWACPDAPTLDRYDHTLHTAHTWTRGTHPVYCRGYRFPDHIPTTTFAGTAADGTAPGTDAQADAEAHLAERRHHSHQLTRGDTIIDSADRIAGYRSTP